MVIQPSRKGPGRPKAWPRRVTCGRVSVTIYRRKTPNGAPGYLVANYAGGKRRFDSYTSEAEALEAASVLARRLSEREVVAASLTEPQAVDFAAATQALAPFKLSLAAVAAAVADCLPLVDGKLANLSAAAKEYAERHAVTPTPVQAVIELLLAAKVKKSSRYRQDLASRLARFGEAFKTNIAEVSGPMIQAWLDGLNLSDKSRLNYRRAVLTLFNFASKRGLLPRGTNAAKDTENIEVEGGHIAIYSLEQMTRLLQAASTRTLPVLVLCGFCGLRTAEALRLSWEDINFEQGHVIVEAHKSKTASRRIVPLPENAVAWLAPYRERTGKVWGLSAHSFIPERVAGARTAKVKWRSNALRHSFISYRVAQTQNVNQTALEAGNSAQVIFSNYRQLATPAQAAAWFAIRPEAPANVLPLSQAANA